MVLPASRRFEGEVGKIKSSVLDTLTLQVQAPAHLQNSCQSDVSLQSKQTNEMNE